MRKFLQRPEAVVAILLVLVFWAEAAFTPHFFDIRYLLNRTALSAETGLLALGVTFVIITGEIDLSIASTMALVACALAKMAGSMPIPVAIVLALVLGGLLGAFNGLLVAKAKLPSFLVTLGTMALYRGIAQAWMSSSSTALPASLQGADMLDLPLVGIPLPFGIVLVFAVLLGLVLHRTVVGRWVYAVGINERAAFYSGVPTRAVKFWVFVLVGVLAAIAALLIDSRLGIARFDHGRGMELDAITAAVLGGTSIYGGRGTIFGTVLALLLIAVIQTGMTLANVSAGVQLTVVGTLLVFAVALTAATGRLAVRKPAGVAPANGE